VDIAHRLGPPQRRRFGPLVRALSYVRPSGGLQPTQSHTCRNRMPSLTRGQRFEGLVGDHIRAVHRAHVTARYTGTLASSSCRPGRERRRQSCPARGGPLRHRELDVGGDVGGGEAHGPPCSWCRAVRSSLAWHQVTAQMSPLLTKSLPPAYSRMTAVVRATLSHSQPDIDSAQRSSSNAVPFH